MAWGRFGVGCCCSANGTVNVTVHGCNDLPLVGATVAASHSGFGSVAGTTDSSGVASLAVPAASAWLITVSAARFATRSGSLTVASGITYDINYTGSSKMTPASGYACCPVCATPISTTLHLVDASSSPLALAYDGASYWYGCYQATVSGSTGPACTPGSASVSVFYRVSCTQAGNVWSLEKYWYQCSASNAAFYSSTCAAPGSGSIATGTPDPSNPNAFRKGTGFITATIANPCLPVALAFSVAGGPYAGTVTVSE